MKHYEFPLIKCKHGKDFCCLCRYGNYGQMRDEENVRDLIDDLKTSVEFKLKLVYNNWHENE